MSDLSGIHTKSELTLSNKLGFLNTSRSRNLVRDVWRRNDGGKILVDWLDVAQEYDWEIIFA